MGVSAKISRNVPIIIFDNQNIKEKVENLFVTNEKKINERIDEILEFLEMQDEEILSYDNIKSTFKIYFYKYIANKAVEMAFDEGENYNILSNIMFLLNEENFNDAIMGETMINAIERLMSNVPIESTLSTVIIGSKKILLEKKFLKNNLFSELYN